MAGILIRDGRLLLVRQRFAGREFSSLPGGKLEPGDVIDSEFVGLGVARERLATLPFPAMREPVLAYLDGAAQSFYSYVTGGDPTEARRTVPR
ncbi:hypothetical protein [Actinocatenispora thailandica]|uniref:hypothetical protein n=1 Tax=Actinocatenispora thailandica TaxID=227318 RepID=UPI00194E2560|nr:hypothetical protein [Actinocatenispora thailandica]